VYAPSAVPGIVCSISGHDDQPRLAVVAEPERVRRPRGDRHDVLERAAQLDAQDVAVDVEAELAPTEASNHPLGERAVHGGDDRRRGQAARDLERQVWTGQRGHALERQLRG
jgi:hypothetical protein